MRLREDRVQEFSELWKQEFGEELSLESARHEAALLVQLYLSLAEPLPEERATRAAASGPPQEP